MKFHASTENAAEISALTEALLTTPVGAVVTYAALSRAIGRPVQARRYLLLHAIERANAESGALFGNVRGVGYSRLAGVDTGLIGGTARRKIRRASKRASEFMSKALASTNDLPAPIQRKVVAEIAALAMISHITKDRVVKALANHDRPPPVAESFRGVLALFGVAA